MSVLQVERLTSGYSQTVIIKNIDLRIEEGKIMCILGRNGVGKSTLLKTIMSVNPVMSGKISFGGTEITNLKSHQIERLGIAYAPQEAALFSQLSVEQNLRMGLKTSKREFLKKCQYAFDYFPILEDRKGQQAGTLSGGEQKMLLMARAMIRTPKLMILDEVTEGVQPSVIDKISDAMKSIQQEHGTTILMVEQNVNFASRTADYYAVMNQGEILEQGIANENIKHTLEKHLTI